MRCHQPQERQVAFSFKGSGSGFEYFTAYLLEESRATPPLLVIELTDLVFALSSARSS
jgi:hypothetical protein